jgi:hypothetical protein
MPASMMTTPEAPKRESAPERKGPGKDEREEPKEIGIELHFSGAPAFPAQLILGAIEAVERAVSWEEREEIEAMQKDLGDVVPEAVFDAIRYRIDRTAGRAINFDRASSGSLILGGIAAGLAIWFLDKTLGETVKDSWLESSFHERLKQFLSLRLKGKAQRIAKNIRPSRWNPGDAEVEISVKQTGPSSEIIVCTFIPGPALQPLPTHREVLVAIRDRRPAPPRHR